MPRVQPISIELRSYHLIEVISGITQLLWQVCFRYSLYLFSWPLKERRIWQWREDYGSAFRRSKAEHQASPLLAHYDLKNLPSGLSSIVLRRWRSQLWESKDGPWFWQLFSMLLSIENHLNMPMLMPMLSRRVFNNAVRRNAVTTRFRRTFRFWFIKCFTDL